ncbi:MAG: 4Fe-4S binding protein [Spirochaetes bacterium]|nr:4Fe-4S binding protein [Spirochaetota bacterium]
MGITSKTEDPIDRGKGKPPIGWIRRILGMLILFLFAYGFLGWGALSKGLATLISRTQIGPSLLRILEEGIGSDAFIIVILILGSTVLFGRWYCAFLCPLGTIQQIASPRRMIRGGRLIQHPVWDDLIRYGLLGLVAALVTVTSIAGWSGSMVVLDLLDPYGLFGRILRDLFFPLIVFLNWLLFQVSRLFELIVPLLSYKPDLPVFFATLLLGGSWFVAARKRGRIYCGSFCPVGTVLGLGGRVSLFQIQMDGRECTRCGLCINTCPVGALNRGSSGEIHLEAGRCVLCMNCIEACPVGALRYGRRTEAARVASSEGASSTYIPSRREFLGKAARISKGLVAYVTLTVLGGVITYGLAPGRFLLKKRASSPSLQPNLPSTPPGSQGIHRFTSLCISCHLCVSHCPTGVLSPSLWEYGMKGLFQPVMDYQRGFCEYECTRCGEVCPTGAILPLSVEEKKTIQIGRVKFEQDRCVVVTQGTICGACAEVCPTHAVGMIPYRNNLDLPATDNALCIGCGSCEHACPVPQKAIFVEGLAVHGNAEVRKPLHSLPREPEKKGFPF